MLVLFAASRAVTVSRFEPDCSAIPAALHEAVPVAVPLPPRLFVQLTCVTATSSAAVPPSASVPLVVLYVAPLVGAVIVTVGAVVSGALGTAMVSRFEKPLRLLAASLARTR